MHVDHTLQTPTFVVACALLRQAACNFGSSLPQMMVKENPLFAVIQMHRLLLRVATLSLYNHYMKL